MSTVQVFLIVEMNVVVSRGGKKGLRAAIADARRQFKSISSGNVTTTAAYEYEVLSAEADMYIHCKDSAEAGKIRFVPRDEATSRVIWRRTPA